MPKSLDLTSDAIMCCLFNEKNKQAKKKYAVV